MQGDMAVSMYLYGSTMQRYVDIFMYLYGSRMQRYTEISMFLVSSFKFIQECLT